MSLFNLRAYSRIQPSKPSTIVMRKYVTNIQQNHSRHLILVLCFFVLLNEYCKHLAKENRHQRIESIKMSINRLYRMSSLLVNEKEKTLQKKFVKDIFDEINTFNNLFHLHAKQENSSWTLFNFIDRLLEKRVSQLNSSWNQSLLTCIMYYQINTDENSSPMRILLFKNWINDEHAVHSLLDLNITPFHHSPFWRKYVPLNIYLDMIMEHHHDIILDNMVDFGVEMKRVAMDLQGLIFFFQFENLLAESKY